MADEPLHFWRENGTGLCAECGLPHSWPHRIGAFIDETRDDREVVLALLDLPFVRLQTFENKGPRARWVGYAAVLQGAADRVENWCHSLGSDPEPLSPWHALPDEAWECFDRHHPGVRDAIDRLEAERRRLDPGTEPN